MSAAFESEPCQHLDGDDRGEVSGSEPQLVKRLTQGGGAAHREEFGLRDKDTCAPSLP